MCGTSSGYRNGCRCEECLQWRADSYRQGAEFDKRMRAMNGMDVFVDAAPTARRLQALAMSGWSCRAIAARTGIDIMHVNEMRRHLRGTVLLSTHHTVDKVFRELSIVRAEGRSASFTVKHAARHGWVPPAAWDRIDDPNEQPKGVA